MDSLFSMFQGILNSPGFDRKTVGRDKIGDYMIDTCDTCDQGYETAIWKTTGDVVIVQRYSNREAAFNGHKDWIQVCQLNPVSAWSVQIDQYVKF